VGLVVDGNPRGSSLQLGRGDGHQGDQSCVLTCLKLIRASDNTLNSSDVAAAIARVLVRIEGLAHVDRGKRRLYSARGNALSDSTVPVDRVVWSS
jgi:hypothetical protein